LAAPKKKDKNKGQRKFQSNVVKNGQMGHLGDKDLRSDEPTLGRAGWTKKEMKKNLLSITKKMNITNSTQRKRKGRPHRLAVDEGKGASGIGRGAKVKSQASRECLHNEKRRSGARGRRGGLDLKLTILGSLKMEMSSGCFSEFQWWMRGSPFKCTLKKEEEKPTDGNA